MKYIALLSVALLAGCAAPRVTVAPTTAQARISSQKALESAGEVKKAVRMGKQAIASLEKTATAEQRPAVAVVKQSLVTAEVKASEIEASLKEAHEQLFALDGRIQSLARDNDKLIDAERRAREARGLWRKLALLSSVAAFALFMWVSRRPLLRILGVPVV